MIVASLKDYLPLDDLARILAVCLAVGVLAPSAVSLAIVGIDRRRTAESRASEAPALGLVYAVLGVALLGALIAIGIYALFTD